MSDKTDLPSFEEALPGRSEVLQIASTHFVNRTKITPPFPENMQLALFGLGCFWGAERQFWETSGVYTTAVGYAGGSMQNPTYQDVCTGMTGHNEVVRIVFDPEKITYENLLKTFWESHNPTQGMRQGNDRGTQYRSGIYTYSDTQQKAAKESLQIFQNELEKKGYETITTEILSAPEFYYAEEYHQQYLAKNPNGYCGLGGTGVCLPPTT